MTTVALPDPPCDINTEFITVYASADGLPWLVREDLARAANKAADQDFLRDLDEAGLY